MSRCSAFPPVKKLTGHLTRYLTGHLTGSLARALTKSRTSGHESLVTPTLGSGKSKWGLSTWGLRQLSTIAYTCRHFATKVPLRSGPKRPQMFTIVDDCAQIAKSDLKPPFESLHLVFPI